MKCLLYIFKIKNNEGEIIFATTTISKENALFITSTLLEEEYFPIHAPAEITTLDIKDYDC